MLTETCRVALSYCKILELDHGALEAFCLDTYGTDEFQTAIKEEDLPKCQKYLEECSVEINS